MSIVNEIRSKITEKVTRIPKKRMEVKMTRRDEEELDWYITSLIALGA